MLENKERERNVVFQNLFQIERCDIDLSYIFSTLVNILFLDNLYFIKIYLTLFIQKI